MNKLEPSLAIIGSGWLGLPLADQLKQSGYSVTLTSRQADKLRAFEALGLNPCYLDIGTVDPISEAILQAEIVIINITSKSVADFSRLAQQLRTGNARRIVFISSTAVYNSSANAITENNAEYNEQHPLFMIEKLFQDCSEFETLILRLSGLIGYQRHPGRFFSQKPITNPDWPVNLIHRDDCINLITAAIEQGVAGSYSVCCPDHPTKNDFYTRAAAHLGMPSPAIGTNDAAPAKLIDGSAICKQLGYQFIYPSLNALFDQQAPFNRDPYLEKLANLN